MFVFLDLYAIQHHVSPSFVDLPGYGYAEWKSSDLLRLVMLGRQDTPSHDGPNHAPTDSQPFPALSRSCTAHHFLERLSWLAVGD